MDPSGVAGPSSNHFHMMRSTQVEGQGGRSPLNFGGDEGIASKMGSMMEGGVKKIGAFFDRSRKHQMAFAWIVMPVVTALAIKIMLGGDFFHHGLAALKNPGIQLFMSVPVLAVLAGSTVYAMVTVTGCTAPDGVKRVASRVMKLSLFPMYMAGFCWLATHLYATNGGVAHTQYPQLNHHNPDFMNQLLNGQPPTVGGIFCNAWPAVLMLGTIPMSWFFKIFSVELGEMLQQRVICADHRRMTRKERQDFLRQEQRQYMERLRSQAERNQQIEGKRRFLGIEGREVPQLPPSEGRRNLPQIPFDQDEFFPL